jgi:hypothetical protein
MATKKKAVPVATNKCYVLAWGTYRHDVDADGAKYVVSRVMPTVLWDDGVCALSPEGDAPLLDIEESKLIPVLGALLGMTSDVKKHLVKEMCFAEVTVVGGKAVVRKLRFTDVKPVIEEV